MLLYFSRKFLRGFGRYYFGKKSFREKMTRMGAQIIEKELGADRQSASPREIPLSIMNSLPVMSITLTEGFEASLVLAAAGAFNLEWTAIGGSVSLLLVIAVSLASYDYLLRFPRWVLDLIAGVVLLTFGMYFLGSGVLAALGVLP